MVSLDSHLSPFGLQVRHVAFQHSLDFHHFRLEWNLCLVLSVSATLEHSLLSLSVVRPSRRSCYSPTGSWILPGDRQSGLVSQVHQLAAEACACEGLQRAPAASTASAPSLATPKTRSSATFWERAQAHKRLWQSHSAPSAPSASSLLLAERAPQRRWLTRLAAIRRRAVLHVTVARLRPDEDLVLLSLGGGAWRTVRGHVLRFEALERHLFVEAAFPLVLGRVLGYFRFRSSSGLSVLPMLVTTFVWVSMRFRFQPFDAKDPIFARLQGRAISLQGWRSRAANSHACHPVLRAPLL